MKLKILAVFRSHFRLTLAFAVKTGQLSNLSADYLEFWNRCQEWVDSPDGAAQAQDFEQVQFLHGEKHLRGSDGPRYTRIDNDAVRYTSEVMALLPKHAPELNDSELSAIAQELGQHRRTGKDAYDGLAPVIRTKPSGIRIRVFDNTISMLEAELDITDYMGAGENGPDLDALREFAVFLGEALVLFYYRQSVFSLLDLLASDRDRANRFVEPLVSDDETLKRLNDHGDDFRFPLAERPEGQSPGPEILWVSRSLICETDDASKMALDEVVETWLKDVGDPEKAKQTSRDPGAFCVLWGNYAFREDFVESREFTELWGSLSLCQYYYSALDALNDRLNGVIAVSNRVAKELHVQSLREALDETVQRAAILLLNYDDTQNYMSRAKLSAFRDIMEYWEFERFEAATRERMRVCRERLEDLHRKSSEKSSRYIEFLLFGIGLLAILDFGVGLAMFGRAPGDSAFAQDERYSGVVLAFLAGLPASAIIAGAIAMIVGLIVLYLKLRNSRRIF